MASFQRAIVFSLVLMSLLWGSSQAKDLLVGGKTDAWKIPSSESDSLNKWAGKARFLIGDSLVWKYDGQKDSVLQVTKEAYAACNTTNPIEEYKDGNTKVKLDRSGPFYFISGAEGHCEKGQKIVVVVLSEKHTQVGNHVGSPAPSPVEFEGPAVAPTSSASNLEGGLLVALGVLVLGLF
ncbi:PREDICTED: early nodulin-like protein 1 [Populus euphratica]|uniref:Early nodulin-like protein 1 n=1 Tax=Populus euphratica TaxID=75702 RepID=A0AAJ6UWM4_POPEU|nr:PREDICTED: early nodulin-like protein 1 [Populus euphratica]